MIYWLISWCQAAFEVWVDSARCWKVWACWCSDIEYCWLKLDSIQFVLYSYMVFKNISFGCIHKLFALTHLFIIYCELITAVTWRCVGCHTDYHFVAKAIECCCFDIHLWQEWDSRQHTNHPCQFTVFMTGYFETCHGCPDGYQAIWILHLNSQDTFSLTEIIHHNQW